MAIKSVSSSKPAQRAATNAQALVELDHYKILVESIEDYAIFLLDTHGTIITWNKGAQKTKGYKPSEIIGQHFSKFYQEEDVIADKPGHELMLAIKRGRVEDEDWRVRKDGTKFWANVVITTLYDADGKHIGFAKVTRDLTERKKQEDAVRRINVQLRQQQQELEQLNNSKDEFISLASHQLRTPATAIKQLLGLLVEGLYGDVPAQLTPVIEKAYESNERQLNIVNSLLKVAQIDSGKVTLHKHDNDLRPMLRGLIEEFSDTFKTREQSVELSLPHHEVLALVDHDYLRMAVSNLIDNASKYTPKGGKITVKLSENRAHIKIDVVDNGVGIAKDDIEKLFKKFVRLDNIMSQKVGGSGLGLYWLQKVVELHDGVVEVESAPDKGTKFTIVLPKVEA